MPPPQRGFGYYLFDDTCAYFAVDCPDCTTRGNYDQTCLYVDEDRSLTWSTDSSEGNHWVEYVGGDSVVYRALLDTTPRVWAMGDCPALSAFSVQSGHLSSEASIPFGVRKWQYNCAPGDEVGFFQYVALAPGNQYLGWWPPGLVTSQWAKPRYYGLLILEHFIRPFGGPA